MEAVVSTPLCLLYAVASAGAECPDRLLCSQVAKLLKELSIGWRRARTKYRYEGWAHREHLRPAGDWTGWNKRFVRAPFANVLARPEVEGPVLGTLPWGALVAPTGEAGEGWQRIALPDGREGYTKRSPWEDDYKTPPVASGEALRTRTVEVAPFYQGTQCRQDGKFPLDVNYSGLAFMAWFFCGVSLHRDVRLVNGFPMRPVSFGVRRPGDLLYFLGHIALYLGSDRYIHSIARAGGDGVVISSLDPAVPDCRVDLQEKSYAVGSVFLLAQGGGHGYSSLPLVRLSAGAVLGAVPSFVISGSGA